MAEYMKQLMILARSCLKRVSNSRVSRCDFGVSAYPDGTLAFTDHKRSEVGGEPAIRRTNYIITDIYKLRQ
jgi:hypothetical protein